MAFQPMARQQHWVVEDHARLPSGGESDLCCTEDAWDSLSSSSSSSSSSAAGAAALPRGSASKQQQQQEQRRASGARLPTQIERAQLRRSRPSAPGAVCKGDERIECLLAMVRAQHKFMPAGVTGSEGRALCHSVSPFVAERRGLFVAWENQMATFLGYSRDTVAVALNYFDRYTCAKTCSPTLAQAVAATALHIAAKFEETNPASLRQLLKYTPVFTPEQLLLMEMSLLQVLNWDLRPVTVYDFVRAFCNLLLPGGESSGASGSSSAGTGSSGVAVTLQSKEEKEKELERLRVGAEDIADLASFDVCFVDFLPSTLATAALLLSVSRGTSASDPSTTPSSSGLLRPTSHADVLDTFRRVMTENVSGAADGGAGTGGTAAGNLHRVLECVQLLGSSLAERYPAVGAASASAAEGLARYAGLPVERCGQEEAAVGVPPGPSKAVTTTPVAVAKSRRCATPTGVEGIMHIEMDAIRSASGGDVGADQQKQEQQHQPQSLSSETESFPGGEGGESNSDVTTTGTNDAPVSVSIGSGAAAAAAAGARAAGARAAGNQQQHRQRPTAFTTAAAAAGHNTTAGMERQQQQQQQQQRQRIRSESFTYTSEEIAFSRAVKQKNTHVRHAATGGVIGGSELTPEASAAGAAVATSTTVMSNNSRKRSAEALGHCESGSGFGAPSARFSGRVAGGASSSKAARVL